MIIRVVSSDLEVSSVEKFNRPRMVLALLHEAGLVDDLKPFNIQILVFTLSEYKRRCTIHKDQSSSRQSKISDYFCTM